MIQENITVFSTARSLPSRFQDAAGRCSQAVLKRSFYVLPTCGQLVQPVTYLTAYEHGLTIFYSRNLKKGFPIFLQRKFSLPAAYTSLNAETASSFPVDGCWNWMWCRSVLPFLLTSLFRYHSRMIPWQFQYCHLTGVWVTYPYLAWSPILLWSFLFCYHTFFDFNQFTHWSRCAPWLIVVSKGNVYSEQESKQMEIPWQLCYPMHNTDWAVGAACLDLPEWFLHTGLFKRIPFIKKAYYIQLICNMMSFRATHRHRSENPLQCDFYCFYLQWKQQKRSHFQPRIGWWDMMEYRM